MDCGCVLTIDFVKTLFRTKNDTENQTKPADQKIFFNLLEKFHESDSDTAAITGFKTKQN